MRVLFFGDRGLLFGFCNVREPWSLDSNVAKAREARANPRSRSMERGFRGRNGSIWKLEGAPGFEGNLGEDRYGVGVSWA